MDDQFRRDIYTEYLFTGLAPHPNAEEWTPNTLFVQSTNLDPDPDKVNGELKAISSLFFWKLKPLFLKQRASVNLDPIQRFTLDTLEKSSIHVTIPTVKNLGPVVLERSTYVSSALSLLQDNRTYQRLSPEEAKLAIRKLEKDLRIPTMKMKPSNFPNPHT